MTATIKQNVQNLERNIRVNTAAVKQQLTESGATPDNAVVFAVAKYHATIEKLAKE